MSSLSNFLKFGSVFAMITGGADVLIGTRMIEIGTGESFPINSPTAALIDSQIRFLGGMWAAVGAVVWWISNDIQARSVPLAILGGWVFVGGIGRAISGALHGFSSPIVVSFTAVELVGPPAIWLLGF